MSYLQIKQIHKIFGRQTILNHISFTAEQGEFVTLLGPSGCGKSSLLRCISGLTSLDGGQIVLDGKEITHMAPKHRQISMVFQHYALFPNMTVFENIAFGLKMQKLPKEQIQFAVEKMVDLVDLKPHLHKLPTALSGGQCQRVALARSLIVKPKLLLLDEPLSALDAKIRKHLRQQLRYIQKELNMTMLFVTHDQEEALTMSDKIILLNQGNIEQMGDAESLYLSPSSRFVAEFIGHYNLLSAHDFQHLTQQTSEQSVAIRPESIKIGEQGIDAEVVDYAMLGNIIRYQVMVRGIVLSVDHLHRSEHDLFKVKTPIKISFTPNQFHFIRH